MDILKILKARKENSIRSSNEIEEKIEKNFMHAFKWGYHSDLYFEQRIILEVNSLIEFLKRSPNMVEALKEYQDRSTRSLIRNFPSHGSKESENIASKLDYQAELEIARLAQDMIEVIEQMKEEGN